MAATEKPVTELTPKTNTSALTGKAVVTYSKSDGSADAFDGDRLKTMLDNIDERTPLHRISLEANTGLVLYGSVLVSVVGGMEASINHTFLVNTEDDGGWVTLLTSPKMDGLESWINFYFDDNWQIVLWAEASSGGVTITVCDLDGSFNGTITTTKPTETIDLNVIAVESGLNELDTRKLDKLIGSTEGNIVVTKQDGTVEDSGVSLASLRAPGILEGIADSTSAGTAQEIVFRQSGGDGVNYIKRFKGRTLAWNQLVNPNTAEASKTESGITFTKNVDNSISVSGTATAQVTYLVGNYAIVSGRKYLLSGCPVGGGAGTYRLYLSDAGIAASEYGGGVIATAVQTGPTRIRIVVPNGATITNAIMFYPQLHDLTLLYGTEIDGLTDAEILAKYEADFGTGYYPYNAGELISNDAEELETVGFNQWDEEWEKGSINSSGENQSGDGIRSKNYNPAFPNTTYFINDPAVLYVVYFYDANKELIPYTGAGAYANGYNGGATPFTAPAGTAYFRLRTASQYGNTYKNDICINLSDPAKNGTYEPYWKRTINLGLDSFKVKDGQGNVLTITGGLKSAGTVHDEIVGNKYIKRIGEVDLGTLNFVRTDYGDVYAFLVNIGKARGGNMICPKYSISQVAAVVNMDDKTILSSSNANLYIRDDSYTDVASFKSAMSGVMLYYELATPIEYELAEPMPNAILVDELGTEKAIFPTHEDGSPSAPLCVDSNYSISVAKLVSIVKSLSNESNG